MAKLAVALGHILIIFFFWCPFILFSLAMIICGGGQGLGYLVFGGMTLFLIHRTFLKATSGIMKKTSDSALPNTPENIISRNAGYIIAASQQGASDEEITQNLLQAGWKMEDVTAAFAETQ